MGKLDGVKYDTVIRFDAVKKAFIVRIKDGTETQEISVPEVAVNACRPHYAAPKKR